MKKLILILIALIIIPSFAYAEPENYSANKSGISIWTITWDDGAANTANIVPDTDTAMNVFRALSVSISCSTLAADDIGGASTGEPADVDVLASNDCSAFDTDDDSDNGNYYVEDFVSNIDDNENTTGELTVGAIRCIKLRMDNEDAANTRDMTCRVNAVWN